MSFPIADLHCDLLFYLALNGGRTPFDAHLPCSLSHFRSGKVSLQLLPAYAERVPGASIIGKRQVDCFFQLLHRYPNAFTLFSSPTDPSKGVVCILLAFENANAFCGEEDRLEDSFAYLEAVEKRGAKIVYISLTWNEENRFGGGSKEPGGLKEDGIRLLEFLNNRRIAVDLSHTSDPLAIDILNTIDSRRWHIPVIASHSNFRRPCAVPRNLPDEIAQEILHRQGVIGLNFVKTFIGRTRRSFAAHLEHAFRLGAERQIGFGADFFYPEDFPASMRAGRHHRKWFFSSWQNAACYPSIIDLFRQELSLSEEQLSDIAFNNVYQFIKRAIL